MATVLQDRVMESVAAEQEAQRQHNAMIKERYRKLQNAEAEQFAEETQVRSEGNYTVRASVLAPEKPVYNAPVVETPATEQTPRVTKFVRTRIDSPVFTTEKFNAVNASESEAPALQQKPVEMSVSVYAPTAAATVSTEVQYSLSRMAKTVMAAFAAVVVIMLAVIGINSRIIAGKSMELRNLETERNELIERSEAIQRRIEEAKSEETIREYAISQGMIEANG